MLLIDELYEGGVLQDLYDYDSNQQISVLVDKTQSGVKRFDRFFLHVCASMQTGLIWHAVTQLFAC